KVFKALMGPKTAAYADHVELTEIKFLEDTELDIGRDFASAVGTGGVIGTKFTWPGGPDEVRLTPEKETHWKKWIDIYNDKMLSKGAYLNLYDIAYDQPEAHTIRKGDTLYYAFYANSWDGDISLRGLDKKRYRIHDYVEDRDLGEVIGPETTFYATFTDYLLIECIPGEN
ncbi:MAG: alpha-galactosidase, partial [bacterium]